MDTDDYAELREIYPPVASTETCKQRLQSMYGPATPDLVPVFVRKIGSREEVWEGVAERTKGGLRKEDLEKKIVKTDGQGRTYTKLVSRRASEAAQRLSNLGPHLKK